MAVPPEREEFGDGDPPTLPREPKIAVLTRYPDNPRKTMRLRSPPNVFEELRVDGRAQE